MDTTRKTYVEDDAYLEDTYNDHGSTHMGTKVSYMDSSQNGDIETDIAWFNIIESLFKDLKEYVDGHSIPIMNSSRASTQFICEFYPIRCDPIARWKNPCALPARHAQLCRPSSRAQETDRETGYQCPSVAML